MKSTPDPLPLPTIDELMGLLIQPAIGWGRIRKSAIAYGDARAAAAVLAEREKAEAMLADAERYRWLRDKCFLWDISWQWPQVIFQAVGATDDSNESLEVAIDAAMEHAENSVRDALFAPKEQQP